MQPPREEIRLGAGQSFRLLRWDRSVSQVEIVLAPGQTLPLQGQGDRWHYHRETELTLFHRGSGTRFVADRIELFEAGDLVLIGANVPHYWHPRGDCAGMAIQWDFPLQHGIWQFGESEALRGLAASAQRGLHLTGPTAEAVRRQMEQLAHLSGLSRLAVFLSLLAALAGAPSRDQRPLAAHAFFLSGSAEQQEAICRAVSYVIANYREPLRLEELLRLTGMSRATFARQFHRHAGKSFSTFLNQVRLQAVCRCLQDGSGSISSIALSNGFNQLSFFNRLFRREFGLSPSDYRRRGRLPPGPAGGSGERFSLTK